MSLGFFAGLAKFGIREHSHSGFLRKNDLRMRGSHIERGRLMIAEEDGNGDQHRRSGDL